MANNKILLVEDDQNFGDVLRSYLEMHEYDVTLATDGAQGFDTYMKGDFNLCIFDVMMPKKRWVHPGQRNQRKRYGNANHFSDC